MGLIPSFFVDFRGFRRPTYDSGIEWEDQRPESAIENCIVDVEGALQQDMSEIPQVRDGIEVDEPMHEIPMETLNETAVGETERSMSALNETPLDTSELAKDQTLNETKLEDAMTQEPKTQQEENELELGVCEIDLNSDDSLDEEALNESKNSYSIDEETDAKVRK